jgi:hypothetical protein
MRAHIIEGGAVANTIAVESLNALPGVTLIDADQHGGGIGWLWDGENLTPPPPEPPVVPSAVTMRQARLALLGAGLLDDIDAAINGLPSPQKEAARIQWEYSQEVQRHHGLVASLAPALGLTDAQTDALFLQAKTL